MVQSAPQNACKTAVPWRQWLCGAIAAACACWLFWVFEGVLQQHVRNAQHISQAASWAGQPVGTMAQPGLPEESMHAYPAAAASER